MTTFNVNSIVKVRLTNNGIKLLDNYRNNMIKYFSKKHPSIKNITEIFKLPEIDKDGYIRMELSELIRTFGPYMNKTLEMPFEENIILSNKDLKDK